MNAIDILLPRSIVDPVAWALLHSLWQGTLVALVVAAGLRASRGVTPAIRYALTLVALLSIPASMAATALLSMGRNTPGTLSQVAAPAPRLQLERAAPAGDPELPAHQPPRATYLAERLRPALPFIFALWVAGVAAVSMVYAAGLRATLASKRRTVPPVDHGWQAQTAEMAARLGIGRPVRLLASTIARVPAAMGWLEPVIVMPISVIVGFPPVRMRAVIAHELAHVRRHDYFLNLVQCAVETLMFYHPAVWWISGRVRIEREHCCDDVAIALCGDRLEYARALADLETARFAVPGLAVAATDGPLLARIRRVLGVTGRPARRRDDWLAGLLGLLILCLVLSLAGLAGEAAVPSEGSEPGAPLPRAGSPPPSPAEPTRAEAPGGATEAEVTGLWRLHRIQPEGLLQLEVEARGVEGRQYESLRPDRFEQPPEPRAGRFVLRRDAGALVLEGSFDGLSGSGVFTFQPDPAYLAEVDRLGFGRPGVQDAFRFAVHDVSLDSVARLHDAGYAHVGVQGLMYFHVHGVTEDYLACLDEAGFAGLPAVRVVELMILDVTPGFVRELVESGYDSASIDHMVACRHRTGDGFDLTSLGIDIAHPIQSVAADSPAPIGARREPADGDKDPVAS